MLLDEDGFGKGETLFGSGTFGLAIGKPGIGNIHLKTLVEDTWSLGVPGLKVLTKSAIGFLENGKLTGYYSDPITERGDYTFVKSRVNRWDRFTIKKTVSEHSLKRLEQFKQEVEAKGAHLVLSLSVVYVDTKDRATWDNVRTAAEELEKIAPTVYNKKTLNLSNDSSLFADTHYHLLPDARKIRSQELAEQIKPVIKNFAVASQEDSPKDYN